MPANFTTPQPCFSGFFCPRGSITPQGNGPCPTGYYCPTPTDAYICPAGSFCPKTGNVRPRPCLPGSYNPLRQRSFCTLCPPGHICPTWGMLEPEICPPGFVCIDSGSSMPAIQCPPGYYCPVGTMTMDPLQVMASARTVLAFELVSGPAAPTWQTVLSTSLRPIACPAGTFCLGGVANNVTIAWLPSLPNGSTAPQTCVEGTFCTPGTPSAAGVYMRH